MAQTRREFLWTMGAAAGGLAFQGIPDVIWSPPEPPDLGWTPGLESRPISACLLCPARCGIKGRVVDGRLVRILGNPLHPTSRGGVCPRGVAGVQVLYHPERIGSPLVRTGPRGGGQWEKLTREEAIDLIGQRLSMLRTAGHPESLALLSGYCAGTMRDVWSQFLRAYGSPNYIADEFQDGTDQIMRLMHGMPRRPGYDLARAGIVVSFGAPLLDSWWSPLQAQVAYADPQGDQPSRPRFVQIDTRLSRTAMRAHEWIGIRPETHGVLALGVAYVLIRDRLFDSDFVAEHVSGFEDFRDRRGRKREGYRSLVLRHYRTEEVSARTGVPVERIRSLARSVAERRPLFVCGSDVTMSPYGLFAGLAVHSLNILMGSVNRPGGILFRDPAPLAPLAPVQLDEIARAGLARAPAAGPVLPFDAGAAADRLAEITGKAEEQLVRALFLYHADPLGSSPEPEIWRGALSKIPFIVSFSPFLDETTEQADVILPDLLPWERWQDAPTPDSDPYPVWGVARPLVEPYEGGTHTGDAVLALARRLGRTVAESLPYDSMEDLLKQRAKGLFAARRGMVFGNAFERKHHRQMEERGWWLEGRSEFEPFWKDLVERGGWTDPFFDDTDPARIARTPDGRIALMPRELLRVLDQENQGRRPYVDIALVQAEAPEDYPLRLLPYRISTLSAGTLSLTPWLVEQPAVFPDVPWFPWVELNPGTAHELGL
ncbi:MAG: molybdopterin-dependent oxidoreductase, partial [Gemmatimonadota bacterium]